MKTYKEFINENIEDKKILTLKEAEKLMDANGKLDIHNQSYDAIEELPNSLTELSCNGK